MNTVTHGNFLSLIQSLFLRMPFITTKSSKEEKGLKKKQKTNKQTNNYQYIFIHRFSNNISNHHFHQIYTGHRFPHPIPKRCCLFLGLDLTNCPNYFAFDWFLQKKEELDLRTNWALISRHIFSIHTQVDSIPTIRNIISS